MPSTGFDGTLTVNFKASSVGKPYTTSTSSYSVSDDDVGNPNSSPEESYAQGDGTTMSFDVTFYHCAAGRFWNPTSAVVQASDETAGACPRCADDVDGDAKVGTVACVLKLQYISMEWCPSYQHRLGQHWITTAKPVAAQCVLL